VLKQGVDILWYWKYGILICIEKINFAEKKKKTEDPHLPKDLTNPYMQ